MKASSLLLAIALSLAACNSELPNAAATDATAPADQGGVFVHLFEWRWADVASECETVLGPGGFTAVQVSPPQEHITGPAWWTRYQPVSYKIHSRGGNREEFAEMVRRCKAAGVEVYADAITNHMAGFEKGIGVAGSEFSEYDYPVPYGFDDFHHCGRNGDDRIVDYQDLWEIQHCQLGTLDDLDTGKAGVQVKIAAYLSDLLGLGVAGFRMDAVKHVAHQEVTAILERVDGEPFIYQEVIDRGGEPINAANYLNNGLVTEFKYPPVIVDAFENGNLGALTDFWEQPGWLPADKAVVFVDNHDIQRGHAASGDIVNYKDGARYDLAVAFMLTHPYGYPMVMSSYAFEDDQQGPPKSSPRDAAQGCTVLWICEHRRAAIPGLVEFRRATHGEPLDNWLIIGDGLVSFSRGDRGHVILNTSAAPVRAVVATGLPPGEYTDLVSGTTRGSVDADGTLRVSVDAQRAFAILSEQ